MKFAGKSLHRCMGSVSNHYHMQGPVKGQNCDLLMIPKIRPGSKVVWVSFKEVSSSVANISNIFWSSTCPYQVARVRNVIAVPDLVSEIL